MPEFEETPAAHEATQPDEVAFDYLKSNSYRVIHMSGAHGGPTPNARFIHMAIYNERLPIPQREVYKLDSKRRLQPDPERTQRDAVVREIEVSVLLDVETARSLINWLTENVKKIEQVVDSRNA